MEAVTTNGKSCDTETRDMWVRAKNISHPIWTDTITNLMFWVERNRTCIHTSEKCRFSSILQIIFSLFWLLCSSIFSPSLSICVFLHVRTYFFFSSTFWTFDACNWRICTMHVQPKKNTRIWQSYVCACLILISVIV